MLIQIDVVLKYMAMVEAADRVRWRVWLPRSLVFESGIDVYILVQCIQYMVCIYIYIYISH